LYNSRCFLLSFCNLLGIIDEKKGNGSDDEEGADDYKNRRIRSSAAPDSDSD
jgi:hypothetical protein